MGCGTGKECDPTNPASGAAGGLGSSGKLLDKYTLGKVLGQGAFGVVYKCKKKGTNEEYAVKMIDQVETPLVEIKREAEMLRKLEHASCIKLHDVFYEKVFVCMVLELYKGGDMIQAMMAHWKSKGMIPIANVKFLSKQMHSATDWLHTQNCVHRDVKGDNFMMGEAGVENEKQRLYLSDFGTVRELAAGERLTQKCGTKNYWPPEFYKLNYAVKVDCWAVAVVMFGLVSGKFPFTGEQDVKFKKLVIPPRCPEEGQELIHALLEREENKRFSCAQALKHKFIATEGTICGQPIKETNPEQFTPEMKDKGANAGIAQRRAELVGRLQNTSKNTTRADMKAPRYTTQDPATERSLTFEWWQQSKAASLLKAFDTAKKLEANDVTNKEVTAETVKQQMADHNLKVDGFGKGSAKSLDDFVRELQLGGSRLMIDATKHKFMVRVVDVVVLKLTYKGSDGKKRILSDASEGPFEGRVRPVAALPQDKKNAEESSLQAANRLSKEMLGMGDCAIKWEGELVEAFEETVELPAYPGIQTVYRKEILTGEVTTNDPGALQRCAAASSASFTHQGRNFVWLTEPQCATKNITIQKPPNTDFSALVAPPIGLDEEELNDFLAKNKIDTSKWGTGTYKSIDDFSEELTAGESTLHASNGSIKRVVDIVVLQLTKQSTGEILFEASETYKDSKQDLNRLPAVKRRSDEHQFTAARRMITKYLQLPDNYVTIDATDVRVVEEEQESKAFLGLSTIYRKRFIKATLLEHATIA